MKVALCNVGSSEKFALKKDIMAGFGEGCHYGDSLRAKILARIKMAGIQYPALSFGYAAAIFKKAGWDIQVTVNRPPDGADLVLIHSSTTDLRIELSFAEKIKKETRARVGFIGPMASFVPEPFLEKGDFVIQGEPEAVFADLAQGAKIDGPIRKKPAAEIFETTFPDWRDFDYRRFSYRPNVRRKPIVPILASRGCSESCGYCPYAAYFGGWAPRSVESVIEEISHQQKTLGARAVVFRDPFFSNDSQRVIHLCEGILNKGIDVHWSCETRWDRLSTDLLDLMVRAGCRSINIGVESIHQRPELSEQEYKQTLVNARSLIAMAAKRGVFVGVFFMIGFASETGAQIEKLIDYSKSTKALASQFFINTPFPGTPQYAMIKDRLLTRDWEKFNGYHATVRLDKIEPAELMRLKEKGNVSFFFRPFYFLRIIRRLVNQWLSGS